MSDTVDEIESQFTNLIYPLEGIEIRPTNHFIQRWNQRLHRSPDHFNAAIENKEVRYMCQGVDRSFHFLYRDEYGKFFALIVGYDGGIKTIEPESFYGTQSNAALLSPHKAAFLKRDQEAEIEENKPEPVIELPKLPPKNEAEISEYKDKINQDSRTISDLHDEVDKLKSSMEKIKIEHSKRVIKLKNQVKRATITSDQVKVISLAKSMNNSTDAGVVLVIELVIYMFTSYLLTSHFIKLALQ